MRYQHPSAHAKARDLFAHDTQVFVSAGEYLVHCLYSYALAGSPAAEALLGKCLGLKPIYFIESVDPLIQRHAMSSADAIALARILNLRFPVDRFFPDSDFIKSKAADKVPSNMASVEVVVDRSRLRIPSYMFFGLGNFKPSYSEYVAQLPRSVVEMVLGLFSARFSLDINERSELEAALVSWDCFSAMRDFVLPKSDLPGLPVPLRVQRFPAIPRREDDFSPVGMFMLDGSMSNHGLMFHRNEVSPNENLGTASKTFINGSTVIWPFPMLANLPEGMYGNFEIKRFPGVTHPVLLVYDNYPSGDGIAHTSPDIYHMSAFAYTDFDEFTPYLVKVDERSFPEIGDDTRFYIVPDSTDPAFARYSGFGEMAGSHYIWH